MTNRKKRPRIWHVEPMQLESMFSLQLSRQDQGLTMVLLFPTPLSHLWIQSKTPLDSTPAQFPMTLQSTPQQMSPVHRCSTMSRNLALLTIQTIQAQVCRRA